MNLVNIFIKAVFIDNMIFAYFLGMCSYLAVSKTVKTALGLGAAVIFVLGGELCPQGGCSGVVGR
jgi:Na+-transporting NADH:ubiquinone oxidoreductase subunit E